MEKKSESENLSNYIDRNVIVMMVVVLLLSASVLSFKIANYYPCDEVGIVVNLDKEYRVGEFVKFSTSIDVVDRELEWNFGDSITMSNVNSISHSFDEPGTYNISLNVNGTCEQFQEIVVLEKKKLIDPSKIPNFELPDNITVGEELVVVDTNTTINGKKWEWRFGETYKVNSEKRTAKYVYETSGLKKITLVVNGDIDHQATKMIEVYPKPDEPDVITDIEKPDDTDISTTIIGYGRDANGNGIPDDKEEELKKKKEEEENATRAPFISEKGFELKLMQIAKDKTTEREFLKYFCGDITKDILANGKEVSFQKFCNDRKGKKMRIQELQLFKDERGCIKTISIKYKKRW